MSEAVMTPDELQGYRRRQRMRSLAIGVALAGLVAIFYVATIVRLGPNALKKDSFGGRSTPIVKDVEQKQGAK